MSTQQWRTTLTVTEADRRAWRQKDAKLIRDAEIQEIIRSETARGCGSYRRVQGCWREAYSPDANTVPFSEMRG